MNGTWASWLVENYQWQLALMTGVGIIALTLAMKFGLGMIPAFGNADKLNATTYARKMEKPSYAANQKWNRKWAGLYLLVGFGGIIPFCVTLAPQPWWQLLVDMVVILMVYDFVYYLTHRFAFHDNNLWAGPLKWMHGVHHRQHNPCRGDSSYIHPLEVAIGLGLYVGTIFFLSLAMGRFHVGTIVVTWFAFSYINLHNHTLWESDKFPFKYMHYLSEMHHHHHARFTGGNFATISLLYDWMFGTLDNGKGYRGEAKPRPMRPGAKEA